MELSEEKIKSDGGFGLEGVEGPGKTGAASQSMIASAANADRFVNRYRCNGSVQGKSAIDDLVADVRASWAGRAAGEDVSVVLLVRPNGDIDNADDGEDEIDRHTNREP